MRASTEPGHGYPRPQMRRAGWLSLNGPWEFATDPTGACRSPSDVTWSRTIEVPFAPETEASGVGDNGLFRTCWYRRYLPAPDLQPGDRLLLHFGAVDFRATVWLDGHETLTHEGGYTPFTLDLTPRLVPGRPLEIVVAAEDDPADLTKPRGKQDWHLQPHSIWYPRTTGIWQTVWVERVPSTWIADVRWTPNLERWEIGLEARLAGERHDGLRLSVKLRAGGVVLADDTYMVVAGEVHRRIALSDPGIDDSRNELLWSPASPTLIDAELELWAERGDLLDTLGSYTALRAVTVDGDGLLLNGRPYQLRMVLDQGYWPASGLTPPDDGALRRDVELARAMGFHGVRKHEKIEDPRYLFWADVLGLVVWEEMPSAYRFTRQSVERVAREWTDVVARDYSHPSIIAWMPFNESWGVSNLPASASERHYVRALYHLTKTLDPTRPVVGNDGWERVATDIIGIHDYDEDPLRLARRYQSDDRRAPLFRRERPGGRSLVEGRRGQPIVLTGCGGIALSKTPGTWGYSRVADARALGERYRALMQALHSPTVLAGFCYTQFADTCQEANGLLRADRTPKLPLADVAGATRGSQAPPPDTVGGGHP